MLSVTLDDWGGAGPMTLTFPWTSAGPGPTSASLKFYIYSVEIAIPLRLMLIPVFHTGQVGPEKSKKKNPFLASSKFIAYTNIQTHVMG